MGINGKWSKLIEVFYYQLHNPLIRLINPLDIACPKFIEVFNTCFLRPAWDWFSLPKLSAPHLRKT
jgi:hypothetical protein